IEECRGLPVRANLLVFVGRQLRGLVALERVHAGSLGRASLEGAQTCGRHLSQLGELGHTGDVDRAPETPWLSRSEPNRVRLVSEAASNAVDPTKRECFVHGLGPGDARLARPLLVEADEELRLRGVVSLEPGAKQGGSSEEFGPGHTSTLPDARKKP